MAPFRFDCTSCGRKLAVPDASFVGKKVRCPKCGNVQRVPEVATALFSLLDLQATLRSPGKITLAAGDGAGLLVNS